MFTTDLSPEFVFTASRSSGPGGQHANKVSTRIELRFSIADSKLLSADEKERLLHKLAHRISKDGYLIVAVQETRSQLQNKALAIAQCYKLIEKALLKPKTRRATKPTRASQLKRLEKKRYDSAKKASRRRPAV